MIYIFIYALLCMVISILEWKIAIEHARLYNYKPMLFAAYYWTAVTIGAFALFFAL